MLIVRKNSGFTLIELLVVIAIIAILAAILFPVFAKVREKARQTSCLSNEKQIGLSFAQYYQDYDEKWPYGYADGTAVSAFHTGIGSGWAGTVSQYIKATGVLKDPDDSTSNGLVGTTVTTPVSYGYNSNIAGQSDAAFTAPASTVCLFEVEGVTANTAATFATSGVGDGSTAAANGASNASYADNGNNLGLGGVTWATSNLGGETGPAFGAFINGNGLHTGGSNFLLADGHAKWFRGAAVSGGATNTTGATAAPTEAASANVAAGTSFGGNGTFPSYAATFSIN